MQWPIQAQHMESRERREPTSPLIDDQLMDLTQVRPEQKLIHGRYLLLDIGELSRPNSEKKNALLDQVKPVLIAVQLRTVTKQERLNIKQLLQGRRARKNLQL
ncbi:hypothetical protein EG68_03914 [Paragonimus skrjabini miyazakii]|uniref:Uncharacterized protein n=1 Tax=Paragonimus skrjabini miyazakii TaxID=59628 RepID=A0A8S9YV11_9TREM|nr:hypothetical protein EG68_03914 [Paragonimus skrjabini miyazakii]